MKKLLKSLAGAVLLLSMAWMTACGAYDGNFFDAEHLEEHLVPDLPVPNAILSNDQGNSVAATMTDAEFEQYAKNVYDYLVSCEFERLGTRGELLSGLIGMVYAVDLCSEFEDFKQTITTYGGDDTTNEYSAYIFIWANEYRTNETSQVRTWVTHFLEIIDWGDKVGIHMCDHIGYNLGESSQ